MVLGLLSRVIIGAYHKHYLLNQEIHHADQNAQRHVCTHTCRYSLCRK
jgi:hypothetical protein